MTKVWLRPEAEWYLKERGIQPGTLEAFGLMWDEELEAVVMPYSKGTKYRKGFGSEEREMWWAKGSKQTLYFQGPDEPLEIRFIVEGETDTMRLWQEVGDVTNVFGLPGVDSWKPEWAENFEDAERVYVILDNDGDYDAAGKHVDRAFEKIKADLPDARRVFLPTGVKDICEFFQSYDLEDFKKLLKAPAPSLYRPLNLANQEIVEVDWMVEDVLAQGDIAILFGPPYVGKSVLTMALAVAVATGKSTFLGQSLNTHGRVLYVDEENPEQIVRQRMQRLGLAPEHAKNVRFIHEQGVRLDNEQGRAKLLAEARNFDPVLIVVDSLTRIHTGDENNAGEMSRLFNDGIKPLARKTGATTIILHHANKVEGGSAYNRMRGSIDFGAVIDSGLEAEMMNAPGYVMVRQFKSRGGLPHAPITARFQDNEDGSLSVVTNAEAPPPF